MKILNLHDMKDYLDLLLHPMEGMKELESLIETIRVNETGWFRHKKQIKDLTDYIFPKFSKNSKIRAWSAGCADGREAYTLALCFLRFGHRRFSILGTDISKTAIQEATSGVWTERNAITIREIERSGFFLRDEKNRLQAKDILKRHCKFMVHNLMDSVYPGGFHLIMCRNVLIYMNKKARLFVLKKLLRSLDPNGYLVLGYSESNEIPCDIGIPERFGTSVFWRPAGVSIANTEDKTAAERKSSQDSIGLCEDRLTSGKNPETAQIARIKNNVLKLKGSFPKEKMSFLAEELRNLLAASPNKAIVNIDEVDFFCNQAAVYIRRAASQQHAGGGEFMLIATKPGTSHWARRANLAQWMIIKENDI